MASLATLPACGGGGAGASPGGPQGAKPSLSGLVMDRDGETTSLADLRFRLGETGAVAVTGADGAFGFSQVPTGSLTLEILAPMGATLLVAASGPGSGGDDDLPEVEDDGRGRGSDDPFEGAREAEVEDGEHHDEGEVRIHRVLDGEHVHVRVRVRDGRIVEMHCSRGGRREREVEVPLVRTTSNDDPDMKGRLEMEDRDDRQRFRVKVAHATPGLFLEAVVLAPSGATEALGLRTVDFEGEASWRIDTSEGGRLPFALAGVADLEGFVVEVREAAGGAALLRATAPEFPPAVTSSSGSGSGETRVRGRARLVAHEAGLEGYVEVRSRPDRGEERFDVEAQRLAPGRRVAFHAEDPLREGQMLFLGERVADAGGEAELELDTRNGDRLPGDADRVQALVGLRVEVRDAATGALLLDGRVPEPLQD